MIHYMHLYEAPFDKIARGEKTVEIRCFDEKRRHILPEDLIVFTKTTGTEQIKVRVLELIKRDTFLELYSCLDFEKELGCKGYTMERMLEETYRIYSAGQEKKYGVLGIRLITI